jgi:hypothetical protein
MLTAKVTDNDAARASDLYGMQAIADGDVEYLDFRGQMLKLRLDMDRALWPNAKDRERLDAIIDPRNYRNVLRSRLKDTYLEHFFEDTEYGSPLNVFVSGLLPHLSFAKSSRRVSVLAIRRGRRRERCRLAGEVGDDVVPAPAPRQGGQPGHAQPLPNGPPGGPPRAGRARCRARRAGARGAARRRPDRGRRRRSGGPSTRRRRRGRGRAARRPRGRRRSRSGWATSAARSRGALRPPPRRGARARGRPRSAPARRRCEHGGPHAGVSPDQHPAGAGRAGAALCAPVDDSWRRWPETVEAARRGQCHAIRRRRLPA